jgi:hypothetical protein
MGTGIAQVLIIFYKFYGFYILCSIYIYMLMHMHICMLFIFNFFVKVRFWESVTDISWDVSCI